MVAVHAVRSLVWSLLVWPLFATPAPADRPAQWVWVQGADETATIVDLQSRRIVQELPATGQRVGAPQLSSDGRHVLLAARDGRVMALALAAGDSTRSRDLGHPIATAAASGDGRWMLVAFEARPELVLLDEHLQERRRWPTQSRDGRRRGPAAAIVDLPLRRSLVVSLPAIDELWEVSYDDRAEDIYDGLVHDFRMGEGVPLRGYLNPRRSRITGLPARLIADAEQAQLIGPRTPPPGAPAGWQLINLDVRRRIAEGPLGGELTVATAWTTAGRGMMAVVAHGAASLQVLDTTAVQSRLPVAQPPGTPIGLVAPARSPWLWMARAPAGAPAHVALLDKMHVQPARSVAVDGGPVHDIAADAAGCRVAVLATGSPPVSRAVLHVFDAVTAEPVGRVVLGRTATRLWALPVPPGPGAGRQAADGC